MGRGWDYLHQLRFVGIIHIIVIFHSLSGLEHNLKRGISEPRAKPASFPWISVLLFNRKSLISGVFPTPMRTNWAQLRSAPVLEAIPKAETGSLLPTGVFSLLQKKHPVLRDQFRSVTSTFFKKKWSRWDRAWSFKLGTLMNFPQKVDRFVWIACVDSDGRGLWKVGQGTAGDV